MSEFETISIANLAWKDVKKRNSLPPSNVVLILMHRIKHDLNPTQFKIEREIENVLQPFSHVTKAPNFLSNASEKVEDDLEHRCLVLSVVECVVGRESYNRERGCRGEGRVS